MYSNFPVRLKTILWSLSFQGKYFNYIILIYKIIFTWYKNIANAFNFLSEKILQKEKTGMKCIIILLLVLKQTLWCPRFKYKYFNCLKNIYIKHRNKQN